MDESSSARAAPRGIDDLPRRAWFRLGPDEQGRAGPLGLLHEGEWHSLAGVLDERAFDVEGCIRDGTLSGAGLDELAARLGKHTQLPGRPAFGVPIERPSKILCLGKNYHAHAAEFGSTAPEEPMFFNKLPECLIADGANVRLPAKVGRVDHEAELCLVLGADAKDVSPPEARHLAIGATLIDDVTARQLQGTDRKRGFPWLRCKSFDSFGPIGPWVVPFEDLFDGEIPDDATPDLAIEARVDGEIKQTSRTGLLVHRIANALAYLSQHTTLRPGDLLATGTPEGVSPLSAGQRVEIACERIGVLRHGVE